jgi:NadR type nicotinamide-nucleotide adenylyltransferase
MEKKSTEKYRAKCRDWLNATTDFYLLKKIVIIGPESTGKSTLCQQLADHFQTTWVPEYAREYLTERGMDYTYDDLLTIAKGQLKLQDEIVAKSQALDFKSVFIDSDMYVMKVWCEFLYQKCHHYILDQIVERQYELYLLCNIDLEWSPDPLREYPNKEPREQLYRIYEDILINQSTPWVKISGGYQERFEKACASINTML